MSICVTDESAQVYVSLSEISRLREAESLVRQRYQLAHAKLTPEQRASQACEIRMAELAYGQRYF